MQLRGAKAPWPILRWELNAPTRENTLQLFLAHNKGSAFVDIIYHLSSHSPLNWGSEKLCHNHKMVPGIGVQVGQTPKALLNPTMRGGVKSTQTRLAHKIFCCRSQIFKTLVSALNPRRQQTEFTSPRGRQPFEVV